ncbi:hypothetical protein GCM10009760_61520 [Kitasatospora kazusensis]|uniref:Helix-turn-helix domain-containing protein n=1 Tax=Kitasatospora kazusensis TaxID=407974 RepID=A0ABN3ABX5_9ACTN
MFADGLEPPEVARRLRASSKSAYTWHQEWTEGGVAALASRDASGRRGKLSAHCRRMDVIRLRPFEGVGQKPGPPMRFWIDGFGLVRCVISSSKRASAGRPAPRRADAASVTMLPA